MQIDIVETAEALAALEPDWTRLDAADAASEFYTTFACVRAWWASYQADPAFALRAYVVRHNQRVVGILPLATHRRPTPTGERRILRFASHGDWMSAVVDPSVESATVCRDLLAAIDTDESWDILQLDNIRGHSPFAAAVLSSDKWNPHFKHRVEHPIIDLQGISSMTSFATRGIPTKTRKYRNRLFRDHDIQFVVRQGNDADIFERLGRLHQAEKAHLISDYGRSERHSWYDDPFRRDHYAALFAQPASVTTFCYELQTGELIAARSTYHHRKTLLSWTSAYHPDYRDYRMGKTIQFDILDHVLSEGGTDQFDFGAGRYPWKFEWTSTFESSYRLRLERPVATPEVTATATPPTSPPASDPVTASRPSASPARAPQSSQPPPPRRLAQRAGLGTIYWTARRQLKELRRRTGRLARSARRPVQRWINPTQVWYLARPGDELSVFGSELDSVAGNRTHLIYVAAGTSRQQLSSINADLKAPLLPDALTAAVRDEIHAAAEAIGVPAGQVVIETTAQPSRAQLTRTIQSAMRNQPHAIHRIGGLAEDERAIARLHAERLGVVCDDAAPSPAGEPGPIGRAVAAAYRTWDPDSGRYAVHRYAVSAFLAGLRSEKQT